MAKQLVAAGHATLLNSTAGGVAWTDQLVPFHRSTDPPLPYRKPPAVQAVAEEHETETSSPGLEAIAA
jgi:hypothetical protein